MNVKLRLEDIRKSKGFTQEEVCRYLEIPSSTYRNMEKNKFKKFDFILLFKLKKFFDLNSIEDLFIVDEN